MGQHQLPQSLENCVSTVSWMKMQLSNIGTLHYRPRAYHFELRDSVTGEIVQIEN